MRYFVKLSYKGSQYHGWQYQPNATSIQEELEKAFSTILQCPTAITGAGRTDAGVHASNYIAHFDMEHPVYAKDLEFLVFKLNGFLPQDIAIHQIIKVKEDAHARFDAIRRYYQYQICQQKNPFITDTSWLRYGKLDIDKMNKAGQLLMKYTDFGSFAKLHADTKTNICHLQEVNWSINNTVLLFEISADRFLRNMVRSIVGSMIDIGSGKIDLNDFKAIIESKDRSKAGISVPARGLSLVKIDYPDKLWE